MKQYPVFLFFRAIPAVLLVLALSGCGRSAENGGQAYTKQMVEATIPADTDEGQLQLNPKIGAEGNAGEKNPTEGNTGENGPVEDDTGRNDTGKNDPVENKPEKENMPAGPYALNDGAQKNPDRVVAKNVYLGKINIGGLSESELNNRLEKIAKKTNVAVRQAHYNTKTWELMGERTGKELDIDKIKKAALSAKAGKKLQYSYMKVKPEVTAKQIKGKVKVIGKFTTPLLDRSKSRVKNIRLSAGKIDGKIIMPGEEFSFNNTTGSKSKKRGYENATVIVKTPKGPKHKKAPGGGVCQLSTTLYNAVRKGGLQVTERHEHSDDVHYVPDGKDATVTYNGADFRFVNNRKHPIMLRVYVGKRTVQVKILENGGLNG